MQNKVRVKMGENAKKVRLTMGENALESQGENR